MLKNIPFYSSLLGRPLTENKKATHSHVLTYGAIEAHSLGLKGCIASNKTIANEIGMAQKTVSNAISELRKAGWVKYDLDENNQRGVITPLLTISLPATPPLPSVPPSTPAGSPLHSTGNIEYSRDYSLEVDKSTRASSRGYGNEEVNEALEYWETVLGTPILAQMKANRFAASNLIKKHGLRGVKQLIDAIVKTKTDRYAPRISDFVTLQRRLNDLIDWTVRNNAEKMVEI